MLSDEQLCALWERFEAARWDAWGRGYLGLVERLRRMDEVQLATYGTQELLWSAREICTLGPGDQVDVRGAWVDPEIIAQVVELRRRRWPLGAEERAEAIQAAFAGLMEQVCPRHTTARPNGRLMRLMAALLPEELHCVVGFAAQRDVVELLLPPRRHVGPVAGQVLSRERLRQALGPEQPGDLEAHVRRSIFCWWLHGQAEPLRQGAAEVATLDPEGDTGALLPWPPGRQLPAPEPGRWPIEALRGVVGASWSGPSQEALSEALADDPALAARTEGQRRALARLGLTLGLVERQGQLLRPTLAGRALLEGDELGALRVRWAICVRGAALVLGWLRVAPEGVAPEVLGAGLEALDPARPVTLTALLTWLDALGLCHQDEGVVALTGVGQRLAARLPKPPPMPAPSRGSASPEAAWPTFEALSEALDGGPEARGLVFEPAMLKALHLAWSAPRGRRFVILSGLSGTGKTALALAYARATCALMSLDPREHLALVAVSPDWRDPAGLLGYLNPLGRAPEFLAEPALRLIVRAAAHPGLPFFLILDEMNLARVERYMAPLLSAMETGQPLDLHALPTPVSGIPPAVPWPANLFVAGTINMDETTHPISDKVLDRAFTLEFWEVSLETFFERRASLASAPPRLPEVEALLIDLGRALRPARRHFGYRTAGAVLDHVQAAVALDPSVDAAREAMDQAVFSKVLPRFRGEDTPTLRRALSEALALCEERGMARCVDKLQALQERLLAVGVTRFWG